MRRGVAAPPSRPPGSAIAPAEAIWPETIDRRQLAKASRIEQIKATCHRRRITFQAISQAMGRAPGWFSDKLDVGMGQDQANWTDDQLTAIEIVLEDPLRAWPYDGRGQHTRHRPRRRSGHFGGYDPADP
jgi:hypothetical protein